MDDSADKVRRNTVVLSALIIGAWWLQLKVPAELKIWGIENRMPVPWRVWIAIAAVHVYCFSRFLFSDDGAKSRLTWWQSYGERIRCKVRQLLEAQARRNAVKGSASSCVKALPKSTQPSGYNDARAEVEAKETPWGGIVKFHLKIINGDETAGAFEIFVVPWYLRHQIQATTLRDMVYSSHAALEFLWPILLFIGAGIVIVCRLFTPY
ncbi:hypothetical protein RA280_15920 [Cupriavidus sp. CV2]|uniref:hypothetical protein n=1 Tax=Cupriavidus ulmosensis TaxID=3065913 RepID=UPI00296AB5A6|nr:hypothetical protein [Cupriavidus sp. CV2]MDW3683212.1 hypothetical protein [Cupriavidus sp. CV2]